MQLNDHLFELKMFRQKFEINLLESYRNSGPDLIGRRMADRKEPRSDFWGPLVTLVEVSLVDVEVKTRGRP